MLTRLSLTARAALCGCALLLPAAAVAINIVPGSVTVSRSIDSGANWTGVVPAACTDVFVGDWVAVQMTLVNDSGKLGTMAADDVSQWVGFPPQGNTPAPGNITLINIDGCNSQWENNGLDSTKDPLADANNCFGPSNPVGAWPAQYWMWPLQGPPSGGIECGPPVTPDCGCPNEIWPARPQSPVSLVQADDVTTFNYNAQYLRRLDVFEPGTGMWNPLGVPPFMPVRRGWHGSAQVNNKLYLFGGRNESGLVAQVDVFDIASQTWSTLPAGMNLPTPRDRLAVVAVPGAPERIFVIGGRDGLGNASGAVEVFDTVSQTWDTASYSITPRFGLAAAYAPNTLLIYVFGGYNGGESGQIESLDPASPGPAVDTGVALTVPRYGLGAAYALDGALNGMIYLPGGYEPGAATSGANDVFDPIGVTCGSTGVALPPDAADGAVLEFNNLVYDLGGFSDSYNGWNCGYAVNGAPPATQGNALTYDPASPGWAAPAALPFERSRAAASSDATSLYLSGGMGLKYRDEAFVTAAGGTVDTARVTWIFEAKTEKNSLDFKVFAMEQDDGQSGCTVPPPEGSGVDCNNTYANGYEMNPNPATVSLGTILQSEFGGNICIKPPFTSTTYVTVADGPRPPLTAWIGDSIIVHTSFTNAGAAKTVNPGEDCLIPTSTGTICVTFYGDPGGCTNSYASEFPTPPFVVPFLGIGEARWTFSVGGAGCSPNVCGGTGTANFQVSLKGGVSKNPFPINFSPAPLTISPTLWVDPDGAGVTFAPIPLGETMPGVAGPFYYMGVETLIATYTFTNTDATYSFSVNPFITWTLPTGIILVSGPTPAGSFTLGPGASQVVSWTFAKDTSPGATFEACLPGGLGGVNNFDITVMARGVCAASTVEAHPVPFEPFGDCSSVCPPGASGISFTAPAAPANASKGTPYLVTLSVVNKANRPFVLEIPSASLYIDIVPSGPTAYTIMSAPVFGTGVWNAGQTRTFSWSVRPDTTGSVTTRAGIDFGQFGSPPCLVACNEVGSPGCAIDTPYVIPGQLVMTGVRTQPSAMCEDGVTLLQTSWDIMNTSATDVFTATHYGMFGYPEDKSTDTGSVQIATSIPTPVDPPTLVIPPLQTMTVTFYMNAYCGVVQPGVYNATTHWVDGMFTDAGTGAVTNCCDFANWGGAIPTVTVTKPADISNDYPSGTINAAMWTDALVYSVGQRIRVFLSVSNAGGNDLTNFQMGVGYSILTQNPQLQFTATPGGWPIPHNPWTYTGNGTCLPAPPYKAHETFEWDFDVVQAPNTVATGQFYFTATAGGFDAGCGGIKTTSPAPNDIRSPIIRIANSAQLECAVEATPLVTMAVACATCTPMSTCDKQSGIGCLNVTLIAANNGDIDIVNATPSSGIASAYLVSCDPAQCATAYGIPVTQPPEATTPGLIAKGGRGTYVWTYSPTGLGCVKILTTFSGQDAATGGTLFCDQWTPCIQVLPRYPLELTLVSVPAEVTPGQSFNVGVKVCNPGGTPAGLQGGEPALQFYQVATGGKVTEQYDVSPPSPAVLAPGDCKTIQVSVTVHKNADPGAIEIRVPQGDRFIARDAATNLAFPAVDRGGPLSVQVRDLRNLLEISGDNPTRLGTAGGHVVITYQIANSGSATRRNTLLKVYTLNGELVRTLVDKQAVAEHADVQWDGRNESGQVVASGVYIVRLEGPAYSAVKKLAIVK